MSNPDKPASEMTVRETIATQIMVQITHDYNSVNRFRRAIDSAAKKHGILSTDILAAISVNRTNALVAILEKER